MEQTGYRVGAIASSNKTTVHFFGYGVYLGRRFHPDWKVDNPCIQLDSGRVVFGIECWWGPEEKISELISDRQVVQVEAPHSAEVLRDIAGAEAPEGEAK